MKNSTKSQSAKGYSAPVYSSDDENILTLEIGKQEKRKFYNYILRINDGYIDYDLFKDVILSEYIVGGWGIERKSFYMSPKNKNQSSRFSLVPDSKEKSFYYPYTKLTPPILANYHAIADEVDSKSKDPMRYSFFLEYPNGLSFYDILENSDDKYKALNIDRESLPIVIRISLARILLAVQRFNDDAMVKPDDIENDQSSQWGKQNLMWGKNHNDIPLPGCGGIHYKYIHLIPSKNSKNFPDLGMMFYGIRNPDRKTEEVSLTDESKGTSTNNGFDFPYLKTISEKDGNLPVLTDLTMFRNLLTYCIDKLEAMGFLNNELTYLLLAKECFDQTYAVYDDNSKNLVGWRGIRPEQQKEDNELRSLESSLEAIEDLIRILCGYFTDEKPKKLEKNDLRSFLSEHDGEELGTFFKKRQSSNSNKITQIEVNSNTYYLKPISSSYSKNNKPKNSFLEIKDEFNINWPQKDSFRDMFDVLLYELEKDDTSHKNIGSYLVEMKGMLNDWGDWHPISDSTLNNLSIEELKTEKTFVKLDKLTSPNVTVNTDLRSFLADAKSLDYSILSNTLLQLTNRINFNVVGSRKLKDEFSLRVVRSRKWEKVSQSNLDFNFSEMKELFTDNWPETGKCKDLFDVLFLNLEQNKTIISLNDLSKYYKNYNDSKRLIDYLKSGVTEVPPIHETKYQSNTFKLKEIAGKKSSLYGSMEGTINLFLRLMKTCIKDEISATQGKAYLLNDMYCKDENLSSKSIITTFLCNDIEVVHDSIAQFFLNLQNNILPNIGSKYKHLAKNFGYYIVGNKCIDKDPNYTDKLINTYNDLNKLTQYKLIETNTFFDEKSSYSELLNNIKELSKTNLKVVPTKAKDASNFFDFMKMIIDSLVSKESIIYNPNYLLYSKEKNLYATLACDKEDENKTIDNWRKKLSCLDNEYLNQKGSTLRELISRGLSEKDFPLEYFLLIQYWRNAESLTKKKLLTKYSSISEISNNSKYIRLRSNDFINNDKCYWEDESDMRYFTDLELLNNSYSSIPKFYQYFKLKKFKNNLPFPVEEFRDFMNETMSGSTDYSKILVWLPKKNTKTSIKESYVNL